MDDRRLRILASAGLAVGGVLGLAGTLAPIASLRGLAWGIDGLALVMASALLTLRFYRRGEDVVASGFLVFTVGEGMILSGAAADLPASVPSFGAGAGMWAVALALISVPRTFPVIVRLLGLATSLLFAATAGQIFMGAQILPTSSPLPFYAYPLFVATFFGWISSLLRTAGRRTRLLDEMLEGALRSRPISDIMPTEVKRAIQPRVMAGLLAVLSISVIAVACLGRQMTFEHLRGADRVEIRTNDNRLVKTIRDPAVISAAQAAVARHDAGWKTPWYGTPVPVLQVNFFRDVRLLGGYGIGGDFLTTDPGPSFMSRSITRQEVDEITLLLGVALPSR